MSGSPGAGAAAGASREWTLRPSRPGRNRALCKLKVLEDAMERGDDVSESDTEGGGLA